MRRDGFGGNVGKWIVLAGFLCLVGACAGLKGGIDKNRPGNGEPPVLEAPIINPKPPPKPPRGVERDPIPIPPQEEVVHSEPEPTGSVPDVEETRPTPTPSRPTGKPSPRPGTGSRPATQNPPVPEEPVVERPASSLNADDYTAVLDVTETMELHQKGDLRVWIGIENYMPEEDTTMARKTISFPGDEGNFARITPYAPDFRIEGEESQIMRISPKGSSLLFTIIPEKKGIFKISAKIELFDNPYLEGVPIPKTTNIVSVVVTVDPKVNLMARLGQLGTVLWDNFLKFWGAVVALIFGALLFVTRKFVKKKTGFTGNGIESSSLSGGSEAAPSEGTKTPEETESESGEEEGETGAGEDEEVPDYFDVGEGGDE